jgi:hypothetical protein
MQVLQFVPGLPVQRPAQQQDKSNATANANAQS